MDLSVPIFKKADSSTDYIDLTDCLRSYTNGEIIEKCGIECLKCKAVDHFEKDMSVFIFPPVLCIHLKKF